MSCHGNNKDNQGSHNHSPLKHMLHMLICCGLPILIIGALPLIAGYSPEAGKWLGKLAPFLCPIMMISMMLMMFRGNKKRSCCHDKVEHSENDNSLEASKSI